ncbi:ribosome biogenesis protein SSF1/2 [Angomonas deanei]|uniref:Brix domain containing protein, putative n=1 Tax=Angomonas deanei TaxID=59799 RepID=S9VBM1_9TRYP|nr:ribosome biogenesis protein SSF1/2 [Angomonas deanei]EPY38389.1 ribosome biogenesis protein SSF1/2 [Angomonas deanei]CAD2222698.1 Brix domain containing protein, putative [Angomonas deanei]|eukprot:EPY38364.1 ribosome biogenesis protein SSF1/2 [Angomonas deanei]
MPKGGKKMPGTVDTTEADKSVPKSIVIYRGEVGANVRALMHEWRNVFLPWSSKKLHGKNKSLKDFVSIASSFSVSHLQLFTAPSHGTSLRIMRFFNGPTLSFRVLSFSLKNDIIAKQRRPASLSHEVWDHAPVVVLNNFTSPEALRRPEVPLLEATFKALFPTINVQLIKNSEIQRVCLFHYDHVENIVEVRHYFINAKVSGVSKTVKKLLENRRPTKLGTLESIDEVLEREDAWSDTDGEGEEVPLAQPFRQHTDQCRIKLQEIGPRMTLQLVKVENGFAEGEVLFHNAVHKTPQEVAANAYKVRSRKVEKAKRKGEQEANVERKKSAKEEKLNRKRQRREEAMKGQEENPFEVA